MTHFVPTSEGGLLILCGDDWKIAGSQLRFLAASDDSSFCLLWGALIQLGPPLQVLYVVFISLVETKSL